MAVITTLHDVNDVVFNVDLTTGVREGVVKSFDIIVNPLGTTIRYFVQFTIASNGSTSAVEETLFADIDDALAAYKALIEAQ